LVQNGSIRTQKYAYREELLEVNVKFLFLVNALFKVFVQSSEVPRTSVVFLDSFFKLVTVLNGMPKCFGDDSPSVEKMF